MRVLSKADAAIPHHSRVPYHDRVFGKSVEDGLGRQTDRGSVPNLESTWTVYEFYFSCPANLNNLLFTTSMASIFTNALRTQARVALVASRARVAPTTATLFGLASRRSTPSFARALSMSQVVRAEYGFGEARERAPSPPNNTLYVGNLPYSITEEEIQDLMAPFGDIGSIRMGENFAGSFSSLFYSTYVSSFQVVDQMVQPRALPMWSSQV